MIKIIKEGPEYVAIDDEVDAVGFGTTEEEARTEMASDTAELHQHLRELGPDHLGLHMVRILAVLDGRAG